jgi:hypothetical protein
MSKALKHHLDNARSRALLAYAAEGLALLIVLIFVFASFEQTKLAIKSSEVSSPRAREVSTASPTPTPTPIKKKAGKFRAR